MILYSMLIISYLLGSLSFAIIVSKCMKLDDPRSYGSQNAGATNVMRSGNKKAAIFTLLGDLVKGLLVVLIAKFITRGIDGGDAIVGLCGVMAVIGHVYPIFFKFKGGKGVATAIGVMLGLNPYLALLLVVTWIIVFKLSKVSSLSAIVATLLSPLYAYILMGNSSYFGATTIIAFFVVYKHKANIIRLIKGTEGNFRKEPASDDHLDDMVHIAAVTEGLEEYEVKRVPDGNYDYYAVLGVDSTASLDEISSAYHKLTDEVIDNGDDSELTRKKYSRELIEKAYGIIGNEAERLVYDNQRKSNDAESND